MLAQAGQLAGPLARALVRVYATYRLDLLLSVGLKEALPFGPMPYLGFIVQRGVRLFVAAKINHAPPRPKAGPKESKGSTQAPPACARAGPRGLPALPPRRPALHLPPLPGPEHSTQPSLPLNLLAQTATRGPLLRWQGGRLLRGVLGLAALFLFCRPIPTVFTGRYARLPPRIFELLYHKVLGPIAAMSYLYSDPATLQGGTRLDRALCARYEPAIQRAYARMREAGAREAERLGRGVVFAAPTGAAAQAIPAASINACCLPGGLIFVHSELIKAVGGSEQALSFVVGHEVGHAIGRHSLEKATLTYGGLFAIDIVMGLAQRLLQGGSAGSERNHPATLPHGPASYSSLRELPSEAGEWEEGCEAEGGGAGCRLLQGLDAALQSGLYLLQMRMSRWHEYEADLLSIELGRHAGMDSSWLASGAAATLQQFIRMEGQGGVSAAGDNPLSTHPAATNRLQRLMRLFKRGSG